MLTVCCVWVEANVAYTLEYVLRLRSMVHRHLQTPHQFLCFTDRPHVMPSGIDFIGIHKPEMGTPGWWSKVEIFNKVFGLTGPALYLDLDVLIVRDLEPIALPPSDLTLIPHAGSFNGSRGREVVKLYNSSVMRFDFGSHPELYDECSPAIKHKLWGDQDWIGRRLPNQPLFPVEWFPRLSEIQEPPKWPADARVILCKRPKNHEAVLRWKWFSEAWQ